MADSIEPVTHLEKVVAGQESPVTHLEHVIALYGGSGGSGSGGTTNYNALLNKPSINGIELSGNKTLTQLGITNYNDTQVKSDIADLDTNKQDKTDNALDTTDKTVVGAINEINGNTLDNVTFSADYKNIIINRKNGLNPYTIPIASIIHNAKIIELNDVDSTDIGNGKTLVYDGAIQKHKYVSSIGTDELVKMDSTTDAKYLSDLTDKSTVVNDNGVLKVKKLDGQEVTIAEINHLKGLTMNVMDLVNAFANGGVKVYERTMPTYADLLTLDRSGFIDEIKYFVYVQSDETHGGAKTTYLCNKTSETFFGNADSQRNFITNPIDLANEVTGKLGTSNIDVDTLWKLLTINDTYKTLTTKDEVFGTHGAKVLYDELVADIGKKANATDLTSHISDTNIHVTTADKTKWNEVDNKSTMVTLTQAEYNQLVADGTIDNDTYYIISDDSENIEITQTISSSSTKNEVPSALATFNLLKTVYPIGSIYINTTDVNPSTIFGFGTWERVAQNMTLWGSSADGQVGTTKSAGLPNIIGQLSGVATYTSAYANDTLKAIKEANSNLPPGSGPTHYSTIAFNASKSSPIYGNSTTVQPPALVVNIWKRTT